MVFDDDPEPTDAPDFEPRELPEPCHPMAIEQMVDSLRSAAKVEIM